MNSKTTLLHSGEFARRAGVSTDTVRHYEHNGLLPAPARSANGYRLYSPDALDRVRLIRCALAVGFTVDQLGGILRARDRGEAPCRHVRRLAAETLAELERRRRELARLCAVLRRTLQEWDGRLARTAPGQPAGLLSLLANNKVVSERRITSPFSPRGGRKLKRGAER